MNAIVVPLAAALLGPWRCLLLTAGFVAVAAAFWAAQALGARLSKRREDREKVAAVARQIRAAIFTDYVGDVMDDIFLKVMAETVRDEHREGH